MYVTSTKKTEQKKSPSGVSVWWLLSEEVGTPHFELRYFELKKGQKKTSSRKFYPGYILVQMELNEKTWHTVRNTAKVTGFVGGGVKPPAIPDKEAERIIRQMEDGVSRPKPKYRFEEGDEVRVIDGPFSNFQGIVDEVKHDKEKLRVMITIFGRSTPVELDFIQVNKI